MVSSGQLDHARLDSAHSRACPEFDAPPPGESFRSIHGERWVNFRHDAVSSLKQEKADLIAVHVFVQRQDAVDKGCQLAKQFDADQAAADNNERKELRFT
jgi:hypothetical protein